MATEIPPETVYSVQKHLIRRDNSLVVSAVQLALAKLGWDLSIDGTFGRKTHRAVKEFQRTYGLVEDGVFGPASSLEAAEQVAARSRTVLPDKLLMGLVLGESGGLIGSVNWGTPGGVDCSYMQRRVYSGSYGDRGVELAAFNPPLQLGIAARSLRRNFELYRSRHAPLERAWRLAALAHNWPWAADQLSRGYELPDKNATWAVVDGQRVTFDDGELVLTYQDWADFYALGSEEHDHPGSVTRNVTEWSTQ